MSDNANRNALPGGSSKNNNNNNNKDNEAGDKESQTGQSSEARNRQPGSRIPDPDGDINMQENRPAQQPHDRKRQREASEADYKAQPDSKMRGRGRVGSTPASRAPIKYLCSDTLLRLLREKKTVKEMTKHEDLVSVDRETKTAFVMYDTAGKPEDNIKSIIDMRRMGGATQGYALIGTFSADQIPRLSSLPALPALPAPPAPNNDRSRSPSVVMLDSRGRSRNRHEDRPRLPRPAEDTPDGTCAHCHQLGHTLAVCLGRPHVRGGDIIGCPVCNTKEHFYDICPRVKAFSPDQNLQYLVHNRQNRPMIRTNKDWLAIANTRPETKFDGFPWTRGFALWILNAGGMNSEKPWDKGWYDYSRDDYSLLPRDPVMTDWPTIRSRRLKNEIPSQAWGRRPQPSHGELDRWVHAPKDNVERLDYDERDTTNNSQATNDADNELLARSFDSVVVQQDAMDNDADDELLARGFATIFPRPQGPNSSAVTATRTERMKRLDIASFMKSIRKHAEERIYGVDITGADVRGVVREVGAITSTADDGTPVIYWTQEVQDFIQSLRSQRDKLVSDARDIEAAKTALANTISGDDPASNANKKIVASLEQMLRDATTQLATIDDRGTRLHQKGAELYATVHQYLVTIRE